MDISPLRRLFQSNLLLGVAALGTGLLAAWLGSRHLDQRAAALEQQVRERYAASPYVVASRDVPRGQRLDASLLSVRSMPKAFAPADALGPADAGLLLGGRTAIPIRRGTPVVQAALVSHAARDRLSEQLPDGMRAMTIQVDELNAIAGHLEAGDSVDIYYSQARGNGTVLLPLMQRVPVLATGDFTQTQLQAQPEEQRVDFSSVTLLVSALDAQRVVLAEQTGRLTLLLRSSADTGTLNAVALDSAQLFAPAHTLRNPARAYTSKVELLTGGSGGAPTRSWLHTGEGA
jgi:pilus assembly protein CpaB